MDIDRNETKKEEKERNERTKDLQRIVMDIKSVCNGNPNEIKGALLSISISFFTSLADDDKSAASRLCIDFLELFCSNTATLLEPISIDVNLSCNVPKDSLN